MALFTSLPILNRPNRSARWDTRQTGDGTTMGVGTRWDRNDVAAMLRLVSALCGTRSGTVARRRMLLEGICTLTNALAGVLWVGVDLLAGIQDRAGAAAYAIVGIDGDIARSIISGSIDGDAPDPALKKLLRRARN